MEVILSPEDLEGYPSPGDVVVYTITITNDGSLTLHDVTPDSPQASYSDVYFLAWVSRKVVAKMGRAFHVWIGSES